jgi:Family of unknown function (DUF6979)
MAKYGRAAVLAHELVVQDARTPEYAWTLAMAAIFPDSPSSQQKGCPKTTFLGLCEEGLVRGIDPGKYTTSVDNKSYAIKAMQLLQLDPSLATNEDLLWSKVMNGAEKTPNSQMDVVTTLWQHGLINRNAIALRCDPADVKDPLEEFIGGISTHIPDWADQHDKYFGQALADELKGAKSRG